WPGNTFMTDQYSMNTNTASPISPSDPVYVGPADGGVAGVPTPDPNPRDWNADADPNWGNIRFRHMGNTEANGLMLDGHVVTFHYKAYPAGITVPGATGTTYGVTTDLLRENINVNLNEGMSP
ncbi:MAG TPA: hypothetical protein VL992_05385, partial [Tepidisphaeraceae bacterium]|nr:hypothetical protein [Tepidisphaeraceae bacterium]